ncbi:auxin-induced protein [Musa troglodytarum]|uniref:Auxin-induced protein n=2 Tax=Musa troglodytarum TaxID=320322 RepID=A0A9E7HC82_9LILI|nr:auxin-induced protein [Musa troglodytarum]
MFIKELPSSGESGTESSPLGFLLSSKHTHSLSSSSELPPPPAGMEGCSNLFQKCMPYLAMMLLQIGYAGMNIITKVSLNHGMSHYVLVAYRHFFATISIAPFALVFERRKARPKMSFLVFMQIFVLALLGSVIDQNFYYAGLKLTSPTFSCAMSNMLPAMTFVLAVICRMEKVHLKKVSCQAKAVGTLVTVAGAMLMTLYKGPAMDMAWTKHAHPPHSNAPTAAGGDDSTDEDWLKGCIFLIISTLAWAFLFILQVELGCIEPSAPALYPVDTDLIAWSHAPQAATLKKYDAPLSLTSLICFVGTLQATAVTLIMEHKPSVWRIGFDMNLLAAAYAGIVTSSIAYYVQGLVMQDKGPVFASAFSPLMMIIVAIMDSFILAEKIYLGGVIGAVIIVVGLYSVLWGKHRESKEMEKEMEMEMEMEAMDIPVAVGVEEIMEQDVSPVAENSMKANKEDS